LLSGIDPLLTGELLHHLDAMGHSDAVVLADAHFPAQRLATRLVSLPGCTVPEVLRAVRTVLPLDVSPALDLMGAADGRRLPVHDELLAAVGDEADEPRFLSREDFYRAATTAYLVVRTGETRAYGNALVRKGLVPTDAGRSQG